MIAHAAPDMPHKRAYAVASLFLAGILIGCDGKYKTYSVEGKVTLSDGTPLPSIQLTFECTKPPLSATAITDPKGTYRLGTLQKADGAPAGTYCATAVQLPDAKNPDHAAPRLIHEKYADPRTSGLHFTVKPERNRFDIKLDPPASPSGASKYAPGGR